MFPGFTKPGYTPLKPVQNYIQPEIKIPHSVNGVMNPIEKE